MKNIIFTLSTIVLVSCGPSKEEKLARFNHAMDSIKMENEKRMAQLDLQIAYVNYYGITATQAQFLYDTLYSHLNTKYQPKENKKLINFIKKHKK